MAKDGADELSVLLKDGGSGADCRVIVVHGSLNSNRLPEGNSMYFRDRLTCSIAKETRHSAGIYYTRDAGKRNRLGAFFHTKPKRTVLHLATRDAGALLSLVPESEQRLAEQEYGPDAHSEGIG
jgi:hypothetical protein